MKPRRIKLDKTIEECLMEATIEMMGRFAERPDIKRIMNIYKAISKKQRDLMVDLCVDIAELYNFASNIVVTEKVISQCEDALKHENMTKTVELNIKRKGLDHHTPQELYDIYSDYIRQARDNHKSNIEANTNTLEELVKEMVPKFEQYAYLLD